MPAHVWRGCRVCHARCKAIAKTNGQDGTLEMAKHETFDEFWLNYLRAHAVKTTRLFHYAATAIGLASPAVSVVTDNWWYLVGGIAAGYGLAWVSHFTVEDNVPVAFGGPRAAAYSLVSDLRMFWLAVRGRLGPELARAGV